MDLKMLNRLCKAKKQLTEIFKAQADKTKISQEPRRRRRRRRQLKLDIPAFVAQCRSDLAVLSPPTIARDDCDNNNNNNNNNSDSTTAAAAASPAGPCHFPGCCHLSALTPSYQPVSTTTTTTVGSGEQKVVYTYPPPPDDNASREEIRAYHNACIATCG